MKKEEEKEFDPRETYPGDYYLCLSTLWWLALPFILMTEGPVLISSIVWGFVQYLDAERKGGINGDECKLEDIGDLIFVFTIFNCVQLGIWGLCFTFQLLSGWIPCKFVFCPSGFVEKHPKVISYTGCLHSIFTLFMIFLGFLAMSIAYILSIVATIQLEDCSRLTDPIQISIRDDYESFLSVYPYLPIGGPVIGLLLIFTCLGCGIGCFGLFYLIKHNRKKNQRNRRNRNRFITDTQLEQEENE